MNASKVDRLMPVIAVLLTMMLVGMVFDVWQLAWFAIPILSTVLLALGCLDRRERWGPTKPWIIGFGVLSIALFAWAATGMSSQEPSFGGLSPALGVILYIIWPGTIASGFLYAYLYRRWLVIDIRKETSLEEPIEIPQGDDDHARHGRS